MKIYIYIYYNDKENLKVIELMTTFFFKKIIA